MGYLWRGIEMVVFSGEKFRSGAKKGATLYALIGENRRHVMELTEADRDWPIEILAGAYMPEHLRNAIRQRETEIAHGWGGPLVPAWFRYLPYPPELMLIEDEDAFRAAAEAYDLSRS